MAGKSSVMDGTVGDVLQEALQDADEGLILVNPNGSTVEQLVDVMAEDGPAVRVLADEDVLKDAMDDFKLASSAADLAADDRLAFRSYAGGANTLAVTSNAVVAIVEAGDRVAGLVTDDDEFVEAAYDQYEAAYEAAESFNLRTPAISAVRSTLRDSLGEETAEDFDGVLASLETARGDGDGLDEVTISLLVAAKNEQLLYDISKWGEDVGIASKATFSRTKSRLEELGLIETEKVPIDIGRPRLRLMLGDDRLEGADTDELANLSQSVLSAS